MNEKVFSARDANQVADSCSGNGCNALEIQWEWRNNVASAATFINHDPSSKLNVSIQFGSAIGGCGIGWSGTVWPQQSQRVPLNTDAMIIGWCSLSASRG